MQFPWNRNRDTVSARLQKIYTILKSVSLSCFQCLVSQTVRKNFWFLYPLNGHRTCGHTAWLFPVRSQPDGQKNFWFLYPWNGHRTCGPTSLILHYYFQCVVNQPVRKFLVPISVKRSQDMWTDLVNTSSLFPVRSQTEGQFLYPWNGHRTCGPTSLILHYYFQCVVNQPVRKFLVPISVKRSQDMWTDFSFNKSLQLT